MAAERKVTESNPVHELGNKLNIMIIHNVEITAATEISSDENANGQNSTRDVPETGPSETGPSETGPSETGPSERPAAGEEGAEARTGFCEQEVNTKKTNRDCI